VEKLVPDTSVLIEYIILGSPYRDKVAKLFDKVSMGELDLYVNTITISETLYIASRIYNAAGVDEPDAEALNFIEWVRNISQTVYVSEDIAVRAGELKKHLRIALADCFVIATSEAVGAVSVFKTPEKEMKPILNDIRRLGVKFIDEIRIH